MRQKYTFGDDATKICLYLCILLLPVITSGGLLFDPLPSSLRRPTGEYDTSRAEMLNTTFVDGNYSVSIVNNTVEDPRVGQVLPNNSSTPPTQTSNGGPEGEPGQQDIVSGGSTDDMQEAASFFRPHFGGFGGRNGGGGYYRRPWGWGRRRPWGYGGYGGYGGYY